MRIGVPKETAANERRVALTPDVAGRLIKGGFEIAVEQFHVEAFLHARTHQLDQPQDIACRGPIVDHDATCVAFAHFRPADARLRQTCLLDERRCIQSPWVLEDPARRFEAQRL